MRSAALQDRDERINGSLHVATGPDHLHHAEDLGERLVPRPSSPTEMWGALVTWLWVKNRYHKWNPVKWKEGLKPAVPWWFDVDPYPYHANETAHDVYSIPTFMQPLLKLQ